MITSILAFAIAGCAGQVEPVGAQAQDVPADAQAGTTTDQPPPPEPESCSQAVATLNSVAARHADEQQQIEDDGKTMADRQPGPNVSGTIKFKRRDFAFDLPSVTMRPKTISLDLPQVTMRRKVIAWDNPVVVMRTREIGRYPSFTCNWRGCKTEWRILKMDVPTTEMRRKEVSTDIPEVRMARTSFVTNLPVVTMNRQRWSADLPEITELTVTSPIPTEQPDGQQDEAKALQARADGLAQKINQDVADSTAKLFDCYRTDLASKRTNVAAQFETALAQLTGAIDATRAAGADPTAIEADGRKVDLVAQRDRLIADRNSALASIDTALAGLGKRQDEVIDKAVDEVAVVVTPGG